MPMYALVTISLISLLSDTDNIKQVWYADDAMATGKLVSLCSGPGFGYFANAANS